MSAGKGKTNTTEFDSDRKKSKSHSQLYQPDPTYFQKNYYIDFAEYL